MGSQTSKTCYAIMAGFMGAAQIGANIGQMPKILQNTDFNKVAEQINHRLLEIKNKHTLALMDKKDGNLMNFNNGKRPRSKEEEDAQKNVDAAKAALDKALPAQKGAAQKKFEDANKALVAAKQNANNIPLDMLQQARLDKILDDDNEYQALKKQNLQVAELVGHNDISITADRAEAKIFGDGQQYFSQQGGNG